MNIPTALLMFFLYFPKDKREYIPAALEFLFFFALCVLVFQLFRRRSKRDEQAAREMEARLKKDREHNEKARGE